MLAELRLWAKHLPRPRSRDAGADARVENPCYWATLRRMGDVSLKELLNVAAEAAYRAGRRTLAWYNAGVAVDTKADNTPVTCADRDAEHTIREIVTRYFPAHSILGEEHGEVRGSADYKWIIDP